ncbi:adenylate/guanylate cyclase domain-containing protein [Candidatus Riflebacteria bacterium]
MIILKVKNTITGYVSSHQISEEINRLGRDDNCEIQVFSPYISRNHLQFTVVDDSLLVQDLASTNSFRLNGMPHNNVRMEEKDVMYLGDQEITFVRDKSKKVQVSKGVPSFEDTRKAHFIEKGQQLLENYLSAKGESDARFISILKDMQEVLGNERFFVLKIDKNRSMGILFAFENDLPIPQDQYHRIPIDTLKESWKEQKFIYINNAEFESTGRNDLAFSSYQIKSCCVYPFTHNNNSFLIYLDSLSRMGKYFPEHRLYLNNIVLVFKMFLQMRELQNSLKDEESKSEYLQRYLSVNVKSSLMDEFKKTKIGGQTKLVTMLFADIRGFTKLSEKQPAEVVVRMLNTYFSAMTEIIYKYGGTLDKFMGDAIMAHWGAFVPMDDQVNLAIQTAIEMQEVLQNDLHKQWALEGLPIFTIGIGIHTDNVISGNIGSEKRMEFTVIGDGVNLASRIQGLTQKGEIIISERTYLRAKSILETQKRPPVKVKGKKDEIITYQVVHTSIHGAIAKPVIIET